jgi:hypothetical protein
MIAITAGENRKDLKDIVLIRLRQPAIPGNQRLAT